MAAAIPVDPKVSLYGDACDGSALTFVLGATLESASIATATFPHERSNGRCYVSQEGHAFQELGANAASQELHFTGTVGGEECYWEVELSQASPYGRKVPARRGYFTTECFVSVRSLFGDIMSYPGQDILEARVYKVAIPPLADDTVVATATISSTALAPDTPYVSPTSTNLYAGVTTDTLGFYTGTTTIKGSPTGVHTLFESSDTLSDPQVIHLGSRSHAGPATIAIARIENQAADNYFDLGRGGSSPAVVSPMHFRLYTGTTVSATGNGALKLYANQHGVNVGTNPAAPTSGRAFQVTTTAQATAAFFDDATGRFMLPWNATGSGDAQIVIGATPQLRVYATASDSYVRNGAGTFRIENTAATSTYFMCPSSQAMHFQVNAVTTAQIDANGIDLPLNGTGGNPNISIGSNAYFKLYGGAAASYIYSNAPGAFSIYQSGNADLDLICEHASGGNVNIKVRGAAAGDIISTFGGSSATLLVDQSSATGAKPVLSLDQGDVDESFINFVGTATGDAASSISTFTTSATPTHHIRCEVNGTHGWVPFSTSAPTA